MHEKVLLIYCAVAFSLSLGSFVLKHELARHSKESKISRAAEYVKGVEVAGYVALWYGFSVSFTIINRWVFHQWAGGFPFPITLSASHMWFKFLITRILMRGTKRPQPLGRPVYWRTAAPIGIFTACDITLSNASFMFVTVTFYTIVKSAGLLWILLWGVCLRLEPPSASLGLIVVVTCLGLGLAYAGGDTDFSTVGMVLVMLSSALSGLRWSLTQVLREVDASCSNPLVIVYHIASASSLSVVPFTALEVVPFLRSDFTAPWRILELAGICAGGGVVGFFIVLVEVQLVKLTSGLTLGMFGNIKELVQIALAMAVFHDHLTPLNGMGLLLSMGGSVSYLLFKQRQGRQEGRGGVGGKALTYAEVSQDELGAEMRAFEFSGVDWDKDGDGYLSDGWDDDISTQANTDDTIGSTTVFT